MSSNHGIIYNNIDTLKVFLFTCEEYLRFANCFLRIEENNDVKHDADVESVFTQTKLLLIRKFETNTQPVYLRKVLDAVREMFPDKTDSVDELELRLDAIENNTMEVSLSDGTTRNLRETIEDVLYGLHLHAEKNKIEALVKTNMSTYLFAIGRYVAVWDELLRDTYQLVEGLISDRYKRNQPERASVVFTGDDANQGKEIESAPYWKNLRGRDASREEIEEMLGTATPEEVLILAIAGDFVTELQKDDYSVEKLKKMVYPVVRGDWGGSLKRMSI